ncbi:MAG: cytochrome C [Rubrivivax sp. SCN 70-15]|nr:MAG: cytochrome C [Rubrivivax sp. SCN 70-15]
MSDPQDNANGGHAAEEGHDSPIKTPRQLIVIVILSFLVPILAIVLMVNYVASGPKTGVGSGEDSAEMVARRLQPVGSVVLHDANAPVVVLTGEQMYQQVCSACHATGAAGSPKFGDTAAWAPRIKTGFDALWHSALKGKNAMPPQGGGEHSDFEIARAVVYMANHGGANFPEPKAPEAAASAPAAAASGASAAN